MKYFGILVIAFLTLGASRPETPILQSEYGSLPNPRVPFDSSQYPNQAFSDVERLRLNEEYGKQYIRAYILEYAKSRGIPSPLLPAPWVVTNLRKISDKGGSFPDQLKLFLDETVLSFENLGGIEVYEHLNRETNKLAEQVNQLKGKAPENSVSSLRARLVSLNEKLKKDDRAGLVAGALETQLQKLRDRVSNLRTALRIGWLFAVLIFVVAFRAWIKKRNTIAKRKIV